MIATDVPPSSPSDFFSLAARRLAYIEQRQGVLADNIANADTPRYVSRDLVPFAQLLEGTQAAPTLTSPLHLAGAASGFSSFVPVPAARALDGNAVDVETELTKVADDETQQALVGNLWRSTMNLYLAALGRPG